MPVERQLEEFLRFTSSRKFADFRRAEATVRAHLKLRGPWSPEHRNKVRRFLLKEEIGDARPVALPHDDPWRTVAPDLPLPLRVIASNGVPALGTRTRWTLALVRELKNHVGVEQATTLMDYWLENRSHASEDISLFPEAAQEQTRRFIKDEYKKGGVPESAWRHVAACIDSFFRARSEKNMFWWGLHAGLRGAEAIPPALQRTAFAILARFYEQGRAERTISWREFSRFVGRQHARSAETILAMGAWLILVKKQQVHQTSRRYHLHPDAWCRRPGERLLFSLNGPRR